MGVEPTLSWKLFNPTNWWEKSWITHLHVRWPWVESHSLLNELYPTSLNICWIPQFSWVLVCVVSWILHLSFSVYWHAPRISHFVWTFLWQAPQFQAAAPVLYCCCLSVCCVGYSWVWCHLMWFIRIHVYPYVEIHEIKTFFSYVEGKDLICCALKVMNYNWVL